MTLVRARMRTVRERSWFFAMVVFLEAGSVVPFSAAQRAARCQEFARSSWAGARHTFGSACGLANFWHRTRCTRTRAVWRQFECVARKNEPGLRQEWSGRAA